MKRTYTKDLASSVGQEVMLKGFVHTVRHQGGIKFLILRDITGTAQTIILKSNKETFETVENLPNESVVKILGKAKEEKQAPNGVEVEVATIEVLSVADAELPIPVIPEKGAGTTEQPTRFDYRWLDLRTHEKLQVFQVWTAFEEGVRKYIYENGFVQVYTPSLMNSPSESGAEVFEVKYFDKKAYLAQSPQFYKQMAMSAGFEKVFMVGPVFRAELSYTTRHMTEFTGWDYEMSYIESHHDLMEVQEQMLINGFSNVLNKVSGLEQSIKLPKKPFPKLTMEETKLKLAKAGVASEKAGDLSPEEERTICEIVEQETGSEFVWITDYPIEVRPFYHMRHENNSKLTKSFDLLYKGVEITTGAQREHRYDVLVKQAEEKGMDLEQLEYYTNFFKWGCPPHGGGGIGPGRIIMKMLDLPSVKEATFLPRDVKRLGP